MSLSVKTFIPDSEIVLNKMFRQNWGHAEILKILATLTDNHNALSKKVFEIKFCIYEQFFPNVNCQRPTFKRQYKIPNEKYIDKF